MWQSFAVIGRGSSEIWRRKKRKHHEQNRTLEDLPYYRTGRFKDARNSVIFQGGVTYSKAVQRSSTWPDLSAATYK